MTAWWKVLGTPELTPVVRAKLIAGLRDEARSRSITELEAQRDEILLALLEARRSVEKTPDANSQPAAAN